MSNIVKRTALSVLSRERSVAEGCSEADLYGSGVYFPNQTLDMLRDDGYQIVIRTVDAGNGQKEPRYFINPRQILNNALTLKGIRPAPLPVRANK